MHPLSISATLRIPGAGSNQAFLRRAEDSPYRCFLPDLTGFAALRRAGPGSQHRATGTEAKRIDLEEEFSPAVADCGYRAPLAPRLARPVLMLGHGSEGVNANLPARRGFPFSVKCQHHVDERREVGLGL